MELKLGTIKSGGLGLGGALSMGLLVLGVCVEQVWAVMPSEAAAGWFTFKTPTPVRWWVRASGEGWQAGSVGGWERDFGVTALGDGEREERVKFGRRVVLECSPTDGAWDWVATSDLIVSREVREGLWVLEAPSVWAALCGAAALAERPGVRVACPVMNRPVELAWAYAAEPLDNLYAVAQWALEYRANDGAVLGSDLNVRGAWPFTRGAGVTLAVADVGVELIHQELAARVEGAPHFDFASGTVEGEPIARSSAWAHGTAVAGLAVASMNDHRMVGVAPEASLASWIVVKPDYSLVDDEQRGELFQYALDRVAVQNHSWNAPGIGQTPLGALESVGLDRAFEQGRGGLGSVLVRAAGNGRLEGADANDDSYAQDPRGVTVAAVWVDTGRATPDSEPGASILVAAPTRQETPTRVNGLLTTDLLGTDGMNQINFFPPDEDLNDYIFDGLGFKGTSAATALISGAATLVVAANPGLGRRDVQHLLALSARHFDEGDPGLATNSAGFAVSHNVGYGIPDVGQAVRLALNWPNRPATAEVTVANDEALAVPDDGLGVEAAGPGVPGTGYPIAGLPGTGLHPDEPTPWLPLVDLGVAAGPIGEDLSGKGALILRGGGSKQIMLEQLTRAADAGAVFGLLYNYPVEMEEPGFAPGGEALTPLGGTDFLPMPVMFIGNSGGERLRSLAETNAEARVRMRLNAVQQSFEVTETLVCEQVGLWLRTDHPLRGDLRITLVSPGGTRSVLQRYNADTSAGPTNWTYWSTHHLGEASVGTWTLNVGDEYAGAAGSILESRLRVRGVSIQDTDGDGLDDDWETTWLQTLAYGPSDDPDRDGYRNAFEQLAGWDPSVAAFALSLELADWRSGILRLSWPGRPGHSYEVLGGDDPADLRVFETIPGSWPETEWFAEPSGASAIFYAVREVELGSP